MSQPVKLSDELVMEARLAGLTMERSIAGQVEFWAKIGRAVERVSNRVQIERLQQSAAMPIEKILNTVGQPEGRARLQAVLESGPYPHFKAHPRLARVFIREEQDGTFSAGRFRRGKFEPLDQEEAREA
jgi:hypothetical protein